MNLLFRSCFLIFATFFSAFSAHAWTVDQKAIQSSLDKMQRSYHLMGIQVSIDDLKTHRQHHFATGVANRETRIPLCSSDIMQIGSTSKSFLSAMLLKAEAESEAGILPKRFSLQQKLGDWVDDYPQWKHIRIKQLLNMTSGIYNYTEGKHFFKSISQNPSQSMSRKSLIDLAYQHQPNTNFKAGESWEYSNTNYLLAGKVLEKVTGRSYRKNLQHYIIKPYAKQFRHTKLKLNHRQHLKNRAHGYMLSQKNHPEFYNQDITAVTLSWAREAGAIESTSEDLNHWLGLLFSKKFLPKKQRSELTDLVCASAEQCPLGKPIKRPGDYDAYGLGVGVVNVKGLGPLWNHTGSTLGFHTLFLHIPKLHLNMSIIINQIGDEVEDDGEDVMIVAWTLLKELALLPS